VSWGVKLKYTTLVDLFKTTRSAFNASQVLYS
jgi:hypothetical protein